MIFCPLSSRDCTTKTCAWFDQENKVCALLSIAMELKRIVEK